MNIGQFRSNFSHKKEEFNSKLFNIDENKAIWEYVVDYFKQFKSPNFELIDWSYDDKPHKINEHLQRINIKNKKIRDNQEIINIVPIGDTFIGELKLTWLLRDNKKTKVVEKSLYIPQYINNQLFINGNSILPVKQIIDTIYSVEYKNKIAIKSYSTITISKVSTDIIKYNKAFEESKAKFNYFEINIFGKKFSPLIFFFPIYGVRRTLRYFKLNNIMEIIPTDSKLIDHELNNYYKINDNIMLEVLKCRSHMKANNNYITNMISTVIESFNENVTIDDINDNDKDFWYSYIGNIYSNSKSINTIMKKGKTIVNLSFKLALDYLTKSILDLPEEHKKDTWAIVRYMMFHFNDIVKKKHNINYKRMRQNEYIALAFIHSRDYALRSFINGRFKKIKQIEKLFHFKPNSLIKNIMKKKEISKLVRYNPNINDLQAINLLRFSFAGLGGISGKVVSDSAIDYYPNYLFKIDPVSNSTSSPGKLIMPTIF